METETLYALKLYPPDGVSVFDGPRLELVCPLTGEHVNDTIGFFFNVRVTKNQYNNHQLLGFQDWPSRRMKYLDYPEDIDNAHLLVDREHKPYALASRVIYFGDYTGDPSGDPDDEVSAYLDAENRKAVLFVPDCKTWKASISCVHLVRNPDGTEGFKQVSNQGKI